MTEEQINIAIAEHCGWNFNPDWATSWDSKDRWVESPTGERMFKHGIPDYRNDLNAMHEAERTVMHEPLYWVRLVEVVLGFEYVDFEPQNEYSCLEVASAPAHQRAEAFLRAIGKWDQK